MRLGVLSASLVAVIVALVATWWLTRPGTSSSAGGGGDAAIRGPGSPVTIRGDAAGWLSPGSMAPLDLLLANTNDFDLALARITVTVGEVDAPRADAAHPCSAADFEVRQLSGGAVLTLGGNRAENLSDLGLAQRHWPAVGMLDRPVNQDGCKGASLRLDYQASGVEVNR